MKIGIITSLWAYAENLSLYDTLGRIAALGFNYVDILGIMHGDPTLLSDDEKRRVRDRLGDLGLTASSMVGLPPVNIATPDAAEVQAGLDYVAQCLEFANLLGIRQLLLNGGQRIAELPHERAWANAVTFLRRCAEHGAEHDVYITLETEPYLYFLVNDLRTLARMLADVDHPYLLSIVDLGHIMLARDRVEELSLLGDSIVHAHFSDHKATRHTNQIVGTGATPTADYLRALHQLDVDGFAAKRGMEFIITFELGTRDTPIHDPDDWALRSLAHVQRIAPTLAL